MKLENYFINLSTRIQHINIKFMPRNLLVAVIFLIIYQMPAKAQWTSNSLIHDNIERTYRLYLPDGYTATGQYSLVIGIHGLGDNAINFGNALSEFKSIADTAHIILAYPQGLKNPIIGNGWNAGAGALGIYPSADIDDVGFINALTDSLQNKYPIIKEQTYLFGFSNGGFMTQRMACEANEKFTAFASIAGTIGNKINDCNPDRKVPILHLHGTSDINVGYSNNLFGISVDSLMKLWVKNNSCNPEPVTTKLPDLKQDGLTVDHLVYNNCNKAVELFRVNNAAHILLNANNNDISYCAEIWKFFRNNTPHDVTSTTLNLPKKELKIYPIPATDKITIDVSQYKELADAVITISNLSGTILYTSRPDYLGIHHIDVSNLVDGIYCVSVDQHQEFNTKLIIAR